MVDGDPPANLEGNIDGLPSSQATSCPERATLIRITNMNVGERVRCKAGRVG